MVIFTIFATRDPVIGGSRSVPRVPQPRVVTGDPEGASPNSELLK